MLVLGLPTDGHALALSVPDPRPRARKAELETPAAAAVRRLSGGNARPLVWAGKQFQLLLFPAWARSAMRAAFRGPDEVEQQSECVILTFWMAHGAGARRRR